LRRMKINIKQLSSRLLEEQLQDLSHSFSSLKEESEDFTKIARSHQ
jgi:hypothetical protein